MEICLSARGKSFCFAGRDLFDQDSALIQFFVLFSVPVLDFSKTQFEFFYETNRSFLNIIPMRMPFTKTPRWRRGRYKGIGGYLVFLVCCF